MLSGFEWLIALLAVFAGATVMGTVSFGMGLVVAPVLLLFLAPQAAVVVVNAIIGIVCCFVLAQARRSFHLRPMLGMALGGLCGVPLGAAALNYAPGHVLRITIALVILVLGAMHLFNIRIPLTQRRFSGVVFGFLTSLSITTLSIGGPLAAAYVLSQGWEPNRVRASLSFYFLTVYVPAFLVYLAWGLVDLETLANIGLVIPGMIAGFGLATLIVKRINEGVFRYAAIAVIITGSVVLLAREITPL